MKFISTKTHGYLDYILGAVLICAPWIFTFNEVEAAKWTAILIGAGAFVYSIITDYELGLLKIIPMPGHLTIDLIAGIFLAASPWILGFADYIFWPHLVFGILEIGVSIFTKRHPSKPETSVRHGKGSEHATTT